MWIDVPSNTTHLEILKEMERLTSSCRVTVLHGEAKEDKAAEYCLQKNWDYRDWISMTGTEDEVIIAIDCLMPETITRPHNLLVMVTTPSDE